jgi:hypothetical protein
MGNNTALTPDIRELIQQLDANLTDAEKLLKDMDDDKGAWQLNPVTWSVAQCFDHLAIANDIYVEALGKAASQARLRGRFRRGPAKPGVLGALFVWTQEPPVRLGSTAPSDIRPRPAPLLSQAAEAFRTSHAAVAAFIRANADLDLAGATFVNPFVKGIHFSLATGLHVIAAHERRHLWQAWNTRRAAEGKKG